jgi:SAM-dependent methyltransferase
LSRIQIAEARRLAASADITNARFEVADAQVHPFGAGIFDVVLSSFGIMFFDDPAAAFGNLGKALSDSPRPRRHSASARRPGQLLPSPWPTRAGWARC